MLGSPGGSNLPTQRGLWPIGAVQAPAITTFANDGSFNKYGVYSLFPGGPSFGSTLYSHSSTSSTTGRFSSGQYQPSSDNIFHTSYKVSDSLFSTTSYTFGAPTPPPGSPYSPVPVGQLELLAKGFNSGFLQPIDGGLLQNPKKIQEKFCDQCYNFKSQVCNCQIATAEHKVTDPINCCTRTTPIKWNEINLKKEPLSQISEISTNSASMIKLEVMSPTQTTDIIGSSIVGLTEPSRSANTMTVNSTTMTSSQANSAMIIDEKTTRSLEESSYVTPSTLWQYSAPVAPVPVEPIVPVPVPVPPLQVVRDPNTGGLLLVQTNGMDSLQQAVVWPGYSQHSPVILPSLPPVQPSSFQLVPSGSSHCFSGASFHQQTQAHSTRLVALTTDSKRKIPIQIPNSTLIKIETDQTKSLQPINSTPSSTATVITDVTPLITTHVIYQHPTNFIVSQSTAAETAATQTVCKSQATSPVTCLTPPPELHTKEVKISTVQDASNQTDSLISNEDNPTTPIIEVAPEKSITPIPEPDIPEKIENSEKVEQLIIPEPDINDEQSKLPQKLGLTAGLELLSNSIDQFESSQIQTEKIPETEEQPKSATLEGLDLLCALAEQRIMEENEKPLTGKPVVENKYSRKLKKEKKKSKRHSYDEPHCRKIKKNKHHEKKKHKKIKIYKLERECACYRNEVKFSECDENKNSSSETTELSTDIGKNDDWLPKMESELILETPKVNYSTNQQQEIPKIEHKKFRLLKKHFRSKSADFDRGHGTTLNNNFLPFLKSQELTETSKLDLKDKINQTEMEKMESYPIKKRKIDFETYPAKKRKVGRPKKLMPFSNEQITTETIVAKKPKSNLIEYFLAAKEKFRLQHKSYQQDNLQHPEEPTPLKKGKSKKKKKSVLDVLKRSKIKPKLKAELTIKSSEDCESSLEDEDITDTITIDHNKNENKLITEIDDTQLENFSLEIKEEVSNDRPCVLTAELLKVDKLRVLTAMGGLFYAGQLNAIEPPDVYSIVLDGERGNKPHIMSREEILRDAIVEVAPKRSNELLVGTRVCAYWSQQYRCLYPGSIAEPSSPDPDLDGKFVLVEFDDGDSGRIDLKDIRLLPSDYPVIEYDLNPLLSLTKRKRKSSKNVGQKEPSSEVQESVDVVLKENITDLERKVDDIEQSNKIKEKKHFKKKLLKRIKRDKLIQEKRKKKKHKCNDKKCKERKHHKKHRKHKKRYDKHSSEEKGVTENTKLDINLLPDTSEQKVLFEESSESNDTQENLDTSIIDTNPVSLSPECTSRKKTNMRDRQESCESRSKMSAFLPARQLWGWAGKEYKRQKTKGRFKKFFYKSIQRGNEIITVGDSAVFLSTGRPDRPYIGKIEAMWELCGTMIVKVKWFYHPEETVGCPQNLQYPGALFESPHIDENDVQTISHKCEVVPLKEYRDRLGNNPENYAAIYDNNDIYYLAGYYDPTCCSMKMEPEIPFTKTN